MPVLEQVLEKYTREVKLVFKNYPLRSHRFARQAAAAALAADKQGKFWDFHDLLFENYNRLSKQKILEISEKLALDEKRFRKDIREPKTLTMITHDISDAAKAGVQGTPTIFINGRLLRNRSLEGFQTVIERELGGLRKGATSKGGL